MAALPKPVHLYVKTHRRTGLKYFGRTTEDPNLYRGSGAYWLRHLDKYGAEVKTKVVGSYTDEQELHEAARTFTSEHNIVKSTKWANLLPEDGGKAGEGWTPFMTYGPQITELDAAIARRLAKKTQKKRDKTRKKIDQAMAEACSTSTSAAGSPKSSSVQRERSDQTFKICLVVVAVAGGIYMQSSSRPGDGYADGGEYMHFVLGALVMALTPVGWILAGILTWVVHKLSSEP